MFILFSPKDIRFSLGQDKTTLNEVSCLVIGVRNFSFFFLLSLPSLLIVGLSPGGVTLYSARTIKVKENEGFRYLYLMFDVGLFILLVLTIESGS